MQRLTADWQSTHRQRLRTMAEAAAAIREEWASWNPYRQATQELCAAVEQGTLTLEVCVGEGGVWTSGLRLGACGEA